MRQLGLLATVILFGLGGCWVSKFEGEQMQLAARSRDERLNDLEARTRVGHEQLDSKLIELEDVLGRATQVLQRSSADVGAQIETLGQQLSSLEGQVAELRHELTTFKQLQAEQELAAQQADATQAAQNKAKVEIPADAPAHFAKAQKAFDAGDYASARKLYSAYVGQRARDARAGEAQYWLGAAYLQEGKPATALGEYRKVIAKFPKSKAVNVALYGMGDAFYRLHACTDAKAALNALLKRKPAASLKARTRTLLKTVKAAKRSHCTS